MTTVDVWYDVVYFAIARQKFKTHLTAQLSELYASHWLTQKNKRI